MLIFNQFGLKMAIHVEMEVFGGFDSKWGAVTSRPQKGTYASQCFSMDQIPLKIAP